MKRILGFALFCFAMGVLVMLVLSNEFLGFILVVVCLLGGYFLFCC